MCTNHSAVWFGVGGTEGRRQGKTKKKTKTIVSPIKANPVMWSQAVSHGR